MSYPPVRTEELLMRVRRASLGEESPAEIVPLVEQVVMFTNLTLAKFLQDSEGDSEMPAAHRSRIAGALEAYLETLGRLKTALASDDADQVGPVLEETLTRVDAVRGAQAAHQAELALGPTVFPYLNRVLGQRDPARLKPLLGEAPGFLQWLRANLRVRTVSPLDAEVVYRLQQALEARPVDEGVVVETAQRLAAILAEPPAEVEAAPTPLTAVNNVLAALNEPDGMLLLRQRLTECRNYLRSAVPTTSGAEVMEALAAVLHSLDRLEQAADFDELEGAATALESTALELAAKFAQSQQREGSGEGKTYARGLPDLFQSVLEAGSQFVAGRLDGDGLLAASEYLEMAASQMQRDAGQVKVADARLEMLLQSFELMREAADHLRVLAATGDPRNLEFASLMCCQAHDLLADVSQQIA